jgi:hypothetical protein
MFACGAKTILKTIVRPGETSDEDLAAILDWINYHSALSKFSLRHWTQKTLDQRTCEGDPDLKSKDVLSPEYMTVSDPKVRGNIFVFEE